MNAAPPDLLAAIVAATRTRVADRSARVPVDRVRELAAAAPPPRGFRAAVARRERVNVVAECKRRSPSRGVLRWEYDAASIARDYERAGAAAISVLTEPAFFDGALAHLEEVRRSVALPVLRKDFIVDEYQVWEARAAGADAVLLIVAALEGVELERLRREATGAGLDVLVEVHDEGELEAAVRAGTDLVGVNNRNLRTLEVDTGVSRRLAPLLPPHVAAVAESGLRTAAEVQALRALGYSGFLVGERFMTAGDLGAALAEMLGGMDAAAVGESSGSELTPDT